MTYNEILALCHTLHPEEQHRLATAIAANVGCKLRLDTGSVQTVPPTKRERVPVLTKDAVYDLGAEGEGWSFTGVVWYHDAIRYQFHRPGDDTKNFTRRRLLELLGD